MENAAPPPRKRWWPLFLVIGLMTLGVLAKLTCHVNVGQGSGGGPYLPIAQGGPEQWNVDGKTYRIKSTAYIHMPNKALQYTIEWLCDDCTQALEGITDDKAFDLAFPLMKHAYEKGLYRRSQIRKVGAGEEVPSLIGVAITQQDGIRESGYRVSRSLVQIAARLDGGVATP
jgi:hypothetical protein